MTLERGQLFIDPTLRFEVPETPAWLDWAADIASILGLFFAIGKGIRGRGIFPHLRSCFSWLGGLVLCCVAVPVVFFAYLLGMAADRAREQSLPHLSTAVEWLSPAAFVLLVQPMWRICFRMPLGVFPISLVAGMLPDFSLSRYILRRHTKQRPGPTFRLSAAKLAVLEACSQTRHWFLSLASCQKNTREAQSKRWYIPIIPIPVWSKNRIMWWTAAMAAGARAGSSPSQNEAIETALITLSQRKKADTSPPR